MKSPRFKVPIKNVPESVTFDKLPRLVVHEAKYRKNFQKNQNICLVCLPLSVQFTEDVPTSS